MMMMKPINLHFSDLKKLRNPYPNSRPQHARSPNSLLIRKSLETNHSLLEPSQEFARSLIHEFNPHIPIEEALTPPSSWYTSPSFHSLELNQVFFRGWQAVGNLLNSHFYIGFYEFVCLCMLFLFSSEVKLAGFQHVNREYAL